MQDVIDRPRKKKKLAKRHPIPNVDVIEMLKKLREDEHSAEKISEITGLPTKVVREHW